MRAASEKCIYSDEIYFAMRGLLADRNWFIHKSMDDFYIPERRKNMATRLKAIALDSHKLQRLIEDDLIIYYESNGIDMSEVKQSLLNSQSHF
jgi:hypothetical protein